jgi:CRP-like cAMP-binding protein
VARSTSLAGRIDALRRVPLFAELSRRSLERIGRAATEVEVPAGRVLIESKAKGSGLFVIQEGSVVVELRGRRRRELGPGEVVGELALLRRSGARTARVQAKTPVRCLAIDRQTFRELLIAEPKLALALLEVIADRVAD